MGSMTTPKSCAWTDFAGNPLKVGDLIRHPEDGATAVIAFDDSREGVNAWRAIYEDGASLWLGNQIGEKGRAQLANR